MGIGPEFPEVHDLRRHGRPVREPRPHDVICHPQTLAAPGAAATARRCFSSDEQLAAALTNGLQALSATVKAYPRTETDENRALRASLEALAFELAAALWALGIRPELICLQCGTSYQPIGLLRCPACG